MKNVIKVIVGVGLLLCGMVTGLQAGQYDYEVKDKNISFAWKVDGDKLAIKLSAKTEGWVGIGFNPSKDMKDANFILGYVKDGEAKISDEFGDSESSHSLDEKLGGTTDVTLVGGTEAGGMTTVEFTMPLKPTDKHDSVMNVNGDTIVLLAYGAGRDSFKTKHTYRTTLKVNLGTGASQKAN
ncbi:MAG: DOMON domain-containing protein [Proteobacteria bacterium]|nr:DOMON domain-containing protein [Pseudomonadota bacterium]